MPFPKLCREYGLQQPHSPTASMHSYTATYVIHMPEVTFYASTFGCHHSRLCGHQHARTWQKSGTKLSSLSHSLSRTQAQIFLDLKESCHKNRIH